MLEIVSNLSNKQIAWIAFAAVVVVFLVIAGIAIYILRRSLHGDEEHDEPFYDY